MNAYDEGFLDAVETRDETAADEWDEKLALERYAGTLERRCERLRTALWAAGACAALSALASLAMWAER